MDVIINSIVLQLAEAHDCPFYETSAKTGHNVEKVNTSLYGTQPSGFIFLQCSCVQINHFIYALNAAIHLKIIVYITHTFVLTSRCV